MTAEIALLLLPVACFAAALWWTRRIECDDPLDKRRLGRRLWVAVPPVIVLSCGVYVLGCIARVPSAVLPGLSAVMLGVAWLVVHLSKHRAAGRAVFVPQVGVALAMVWMTFWTRPLRPISTVVPAISTQWLAAAALVLQVLLFLRFQGASADGPSRGGRAVLMLPLVVIACLTFLAAWRTESRSPEQLVDHVEAFDDSVERLIRWREHGHVVRWLRGEGYDLDLARSQAVIREAIARGVDVHPSTLKGAIDAGLLGPEEFRRLHAALRRVSRRKILEQAGPLVWTLSQPVEIRVLIEAGDLSAAQREHLVERLAASWPAKPGIGNLRDACEVAQLLARLGARERIDAHREALRAMLTRSWCEDAPRYATPGGFSSYDTDELHAPDEEAGIAALDLMSWVGVPERVDLTAFEAHLYGETVARFTRLTSRISRFRVMEHLAWYRLQAEHDPQPTPEGAIRRWQLPVALALLLTLILVVVLRAPVVAWAKPE